jgi:hypothetical protein
MGLPLRRLPGSPSRVRPQLQAEEPGVNLNPYDQLPAAAVPTVFDRRAAEIADATALADLSAEVWLEDGQHVGDGTGNYSAWTRAAQAWAIHTNLIPAPLED